MAASDTPTAPVAEGEILAAKYRIEQVIGHGGMGVVVAAIDLEENQRVAVKFLLPQAAQSAELVGRFVREAKASAKLKGNHVTKVLDVGQMEDGRAYIVMEYLEGRDLAEQLKADDRQFEISEAVSWVLQACEGLAEAHALGLIHRDLKPGNLFLAKRDSGVVVKVLDFGISKSIDPTSSDFGSLTKTEMLLGSPLYMAPEQMRSAKYVDERSDIWALGAIAYELLCRRVPFEADTLLDLCFKVAQETCRPIHDLRPDIDRELSRVIMRCLEKDAELRWNDVAELARALEPFAPEGDRGAAARTATILEASPHRVARKGPGSARKHLETPPLRAPGNGANGAIEGQAKDAAESAIGSRVTSAEGTRAPLSGEAAVDPSAPELPPPSSAWGATNAQEKPRAGGKTSRSGVLALTSVALVAAVAIAIGRSGAGSTPPAPATPPSAEPPVATSATVHDPPPLVPPSPTLPEAPSASASASGPGAAPAVSHAAATSHPPSVVAVKPSAKPPPSASPPKPSASAPGGFIRERE